MSHYVYLLINTFNDMKYIGKRSCKGKAEDDVKYMSSSKYVPKDECDKIVLKEFKTAKEAIAYEIELHNQFNVSINDEFYNRAKQTSVGFDTTGTHSWNKGIAMSSEAKEKMKESKKGMVSWNKGVPMSEKTKAKLSESVKGFKHTKEAVQKIIDSQTVKVVCVELNKVFNSVKDAGKFLGRKNGASISNVLKGRKLTTGGYHWKYYSESEVA